MTVYIYKTGETVQLEDSYALRLIEQGEAYATGTDTGADTSPLPAPEARLAALEEAVFGVDIKGEELDMDNEHVTDGVFINPSNGSTYEVQEEQIEGGENYFATGWIDVSGCEKLFCTLPVINRGDPVISAIPAGGAFYDANKTFISGVAYAREYIDETELRDTLISVPAGAKYLRLTWIPPVTDGYSLAAWAGDKTTLREYIDSRLAELDGD